MTVPLLTVPCVCRACRSWLPSLTLWFRCVLSLPADWVQSTWQRTWSTVYISSTLPLHCTSSLNNDWKFFRHRYSRLPTCNLIYRLISQTTADLNAPHVLMWSAWYIFFCIKFGTKHVKVYLSEVSLDTIKDPCLVVRIWYALFLVESNFWLKIL